MASSTDDGFSPSAGRKQKTGKIRERSLRLLPRRVVGAKRLRNAPTHPVRDSRGLGLRVLTSERQSDSWLFRREAGEVAFCSYKTVLGVGAERGARVRPALL